MVAGKTEITFQHFLFHYKTNCARVFVYLLTPNLQQILLVKAIIFLAPASKMYCFLRILIQFNQEISRKTELSFSSKTNSN